MDKLTLEENIKFYKSIKRSTETLSKTSERKCVKASDCVKISRKNSKKIISECIKIEKETCKK